MEKIPQPNQERISSPLSLKDSVSSGINPSPSRQVITLPTGAGVGIEGKYLIRVVTTNSNSLYNLRYYNLIGSNETQKKTIEKALRYINRYLKPLPQQQTHIKTIKFCDPIPLHSEQVKPTPTPTPSSLSLDEELKQLDTLTQICKNLKTYFDREEKLKTTIDPDQKILLGRQHKKQGELINKRLKTLRDDPNFSVTGDTAHYTGTYVTAKKSILLGGF